VLAELAGVKFDFYALDAEAFGCGRRDEVVEVVEIQGGVAQLRVAATPEESES
jgi:hypothetical protein